MDAALQESRRCPSQSIRPRAMLFSLFPARPTWRAVSSPRYNIKIDGLLWEMIGQYLKNKGVDEGDTEALVNITFTLLRGAAMLCMQPAHDSILNLNEEGFADAARQIFRIVKQEAAAEIVH